MIANNEAGELWKPISGWEEMYAVSTLGRVKSFARAFPIYFKRWNVHTMRHKAEKILKGTGWPYPRVELKAAHHFLWIHIHRLVAEAFIPNPEGKPCVNHKDGNKKNNHISNLEWCSYAENAHHARDVLLVEFNPRPLVGEQCGFSKLKERDVLDIREIEGQTHRSIAKMFGVNRSLIGLIRSRKIWAHI